MNNKGFSLVELMIVVIILGILTTIAIPHFREMRVKANEVWALAYVKTWVSGQENYKIKNQTYASSDEALIRSGCVSAPESGGTDPKICGYSFEIRGGTDMGEAGKYQWEGWADPVIPNGGTGYTHFYISSEDGCVIHGSLNGRASASDPPINFAD